MSADKEKIEKLIGRVDDVLLILKDVIEDLKNLSASLKSLTVEQITSKPTQIATPKVSAPAPKANSTAPRETLTSSNSTVENLRMVFPPDLDSLLLFEEQNDYVIIKPKQFLGSENFAKIASTIRGIGGEYISAGRDSHFRVYKKKD